MFFQGKSASVCECICGGEFYLIDIYGTQFVAFPFEQVLAMWGVLRFYNLVRSGITWRGPEVGHLTNKYEWTIYQVTIIFII